MNRKQELKERIGQLVINNNLKKDINLEEIKELKSLIQEVWKELTGGR